MKTVTICGSIKFMHEMQSIAFLLETRENMNVLQCVYNVDNLDIALRGQLFLKMYIIEILSFQMQFMSLIFTAILGRSFSWRADVIKENLLHSFS